MRLVSGFRSPALSKAGCFRNGSRNEVSGATNTQGPPGTGTPTSSLDPNRHVRHTHRPQSPNLIAEKRARRF